MILPPEIPEWVPAAVVKMANVWEFGDIEIARRLLIDGRMKSVWNQLKKRAEQLDKIEHHGPGSWPFPSARRTDLEVRLRGLETGSYRLESWDIHEDFPNKDKACASFFAAAATRCSLPLPEITLTKNRLVETLDRIQSAADTCRAALGDPMVGAALDEKKTNALLMAMEILEQWKGDLARMAESSPFFVKKEDDRSETTTRIRVKSLARDVQAIFDASLSGTVATAATVALGLSKPLLIDAVRKWCEE